MIKLQNITKIWWYSTAMFSIILSILIIGQNSRNLTRLQNVVIESYKKMLEKTIIADYSQLVDDTYLQLNTIKSRAQRYQDAFGSIAELNIFVYPPQKNKNLTKVVKPEIIWTKLNSDSDDKASVQLWFGDVFLGTFMINIHWNTVLYNYSYEKKWLESVIMIVLILSIWGVIFYTLNRIIILPLIKSSNDLAREAALSILTAQVAHDIRSPLAALKMLLTQLDTIPENKRILIRSSVNRINDISNDLLNHSKKKSNDNITEISNFENTMLATLVDSVVSEKRISLRDKANIQLEARLDISYGLFSLINPVEMKRLISNAITNAAEAFDLNQGFIEVILESTVDQVILTIKDNGKGIPPHILDKLGAQGVTHGKEGTHSGSGLGVYHAKKTIESFGGKYEIKSTVGNGTFIIITLKKETPPDWFVQKLLITKNQTIVATDDDSSILEIWKQRLNGFIEHNSIELVTCTTGQYLKEWILNNKISSENAIYLMDYELLGQKQTGLDLIEELHINKKAILVSSRYEELQIKERCLKLGVKVIPKGMASLVPIEFENEKRKLDCILIDDDVEKNNRPKITQKVSTEVPLDKIKYDLCLLDDDRTLIHTLWEMIAKSKGHNIKMFSTPEEFQSAANTIDRETPIFIDVSLGNGESGVDFSEVVHKMGFSNINLATGYSVESIKAPSFVVRIIGKDYPEFI